MEAKFFCLFLQTSSKPSLLIQTLAGNSVFQSCYATWLPTCARTNTFLQIDLLSQAPAFSAVWGTLCSHLNFLWNPIFLNTLIFFSDRKSQLYIYLDLPNTLKRTYPGFQAPWLSNKNIVSLTQTNVYTLATSKSCRAKNYSRHRCPRKQASVAGTVFPTLKASDFAFFF